LGGERKGLTESELSPLVRVSCGKRERQRERETERERQRERETERERQREKETEGEREG